MRVAGQRCCEKSMVHCDTMPEQALLSKADLALGHLPSGVCMPYPPAAEQHLLQVAISWGLTLPGLVHGRIDLAGGA